MSIKEQLDVLRLSIRGLPTRKNISDFLDITKECTAVDRHQYLVDFLDFFPNVKDKIIGDLDSYSNYGS